MKGVSCHADARTRMNRRSLPHSAQFRRRRHVSAPIHPISLSQTEFFPYSALPRARSKLPVCPYRYGVSTYVHTVDMCPSWEMNVPPISFSFIYQKQPSHTLHYTSNTCQKSYKKLHSVDVYITRSRRERLGYRKTSHQVESKIVGALIFFDVRNILLNFTTFLMKRIALWEDAFSDRSSTCRVAKSPPNSRR